MKDRSTRALALSEVRRPLPPAPSSADGERGSRRSSRCTARRVLIVTHRAQTRTNVVQGCTSPSTANRLTRRDWPRHWVRMAKATLFGFGRDAWGWLAWGAALVLIQRDTR